MLANPLRLVLRGRHARGLRWLTFAVVLSSLGCSTWRPGGLFRSKQEKPQRTAKKVKLETTIPDAAAVGLQRK